MITTAFSRHIAQRLAALGGFVLAVGRGAAAWDEQRPPPDPTATALVDERARVVIPASDVVFLDDNGAVSQVPTPRIQLTATVEGGSTLGPLREEGWFADATATPGTGALIVYRRHPRVDATAGMQIRRTLQLDLRGTGTASTSPTRFLANTRTEEVHDLQNLTTNCQLDEIRVDHRHGFATVADAVAMGYDRCAYCFGRELSTR